MTLNLIVKADIAELGYSLREAASRCDVAYGTLSKQLTGNRPLTYPVLLNIADTLRVPPSMWNRWLDALNESLRTPQAQHAADSMD